MVEGHQIHRLATRHRQILQGKIFEADSPNHRFDQGAKAIHGRLLKRIEAHGKNLFYVFTRVQAAGTDGHHVKPDNGNHKNKNRDGKVIKSTTATLPLKQPNTPDNNDDESNAVFVHIHFGMSGRFRTMRYPARSEPTPTTRLRLIHRGGSCICPRNGSRDVDKSDPEPDPGVVGYVSAMICEFGGQDFYRSKVAKLGPDPLREDADKELVYAAIKKKANKSVGLLLMDQSVIAGIGNIYRAEILFLAGVHPNLKAGALTRHQFERIWTHSVLLLQRGFLSGSILTVDPAEKLGPPWTRRYVYNHIKCGRCGTRIQSWDIATRTAYACVTCQPLQGDVHVLGAAPDPTTVGEHTENHKHTKEITKHTIPFKSHCAPEGPEYATEIQNMKVKQLQDKLAALGLPVKGTKADLIQRLLAITHLPLLPPPLPSESPTYASDHASDHHHHHHHHHHVQHGTLHLLDSIRLDLRQDKDLDSTSEAESEGDLGVGGVSAGVDAVINEEPEPDVKDQEEYPPWAGKHVHEHTQAQIHAQVLLHVKPQPPTNLKVKVKVKPGTKDIEANMVSAAVALQDKIMANESLAVEHVAWVEDDQGKVEEATRSGSQDTPALVIRKSVRSTARVTKRKTQRTISFPRRKSKRITTQAKT